MYQLFGYGFSVAGTAVLVIVVLLLFGNRLPGVMRSLGRGVVEFKKGLHGDEESGEPADKKIGESAAAGAAGQTQASAKREEAVEKK